MDLMKSFFKYVKSLIEYQYIGKTVIVEHIEKAGSGIAVW